MRFGSDLYTVANQTAFLACPSFRGSRRALFESQFFEEKWLSCAAAGKTEKRAVGRSIEIATKPGETTDSAGINNIVDIKRIQTVKLLQKLLTKMLA